mgnify:CR=1 FL=1
MSGMSFSARVAAKGLWASMALCAAICPASAQSWQVVSHDSPRDVQSVMQLSSWVQMHEFLLELNCDENSRDAGSVHLMFAGPPLPRLNGQDGQTETLVLEFEQSDLNHYQVNWEVYYFDGGPGDQAWLGYSQESPLNSAY